MSEYSRIIYSKSVFNFPINFLHNCVDLRLVYTKQTTTKRVYIPKGIQSMMQKLRQFII